MFGGVPFSDLHRKLPVTGPHQRQEVGGQHAPVRNDSFFHHGFPNLIKQNDTTPGKEKKQQEIQMEKAGGQREIDVPLLLVVVFLLRG